MTKPNSLQIKAAKYILADALDAPDTQKLCRSFIRDYRKQNLYHAQTNWIAAMNTIGACIYGTFGDHAFYAIKVLRSK